MTAGAWADRAVDAAVFVAVLPVVAPLWLAMTVSTALTAAGTAVFFWAAAPAIDQLERERAQAEASS